MSRFLPLFLDCRNGPSRFLSDYYYCLLFIDFGAARRVHVRHVRRRRRPAQVRQVPAAPARQRGPGAAALRLDGYGADDRWVLLEPTDRLRGALTRLVVGTGFLGWAWGVSWFLNPFPTTENGT